MNELSSLEAEKIYEWRRHEDGQAKLDILNRFVCTKWALPFSR
jgi:hypothetical protein